MDTLRTTSSSRRDPNSNATLVPSGRLSAFLNDAAAPSAAVSSTPDSSMMHFSSFVAPGSAGGGPLRESRRNLAASSSASASAHWHCGGRVDRCASCGALDRQCSCTKQHVLDAETRQQKVRAMLMNAPFERKRLHRERVEAASRLMDEESRFRGRICDAAVLAFQRWIDEMLAHRELTAVATHESARRAVVLRDEAHGRARVVALRQRVGPLILLAIAEGMHRRSLHTAAEQATSQLLSFHVHGLQRVEVLNAAAAKRRDVAVSEAAHRDAIAQLKDRALVTWSRQARDRDELLTQLWLQRNELSQQEVDAREQLVELAELSKADYHARVVERDQFFAEAERVLRHQFHLYERTLRSLHSACEEEIEFLAERHRWIAAETLALVSREQTERHALEDDRREMLSFVASEMQRAQGALLAHAVQQAKERLALSNEALSWSRELSTELLQQLAALHHRERDERLLRVAWMESRAMARMRLEDEALDGAQALFMDSNGYLGALWNSMKDHEEQVVRWMVEKHNVQCQFAHDAIQAHCRDVPAEENQVRRRLFDQMVHEEDLVAAWSELRAKERSVTAVAEMDARRRLEQHEAVRWADMQSSWGAVVDAEVQRVAAAASALESFLCKYRQSVHQLQHEEESDYETLLRWEEQAFFVALEDQCFRERLEAEHVEFNRRRDIDMQEARLRASLVSHAVQERLEVQRQVQALFQAYAVELEVGEENTRDAVRRTEAQHWEILRLDAVKDAELSKENETLRLDEERRQKEMHLQEDERDYDATEMPLAEGRMSLCQFRKSVQLDPSRPSSRYSTRRSIAVPPCGRGGRATTGNPSSSRDTATFVLIDERAIRCEYVAQAIECDVGALSAEALAALTAVVDHINDRKVSQQNELRHVLKAEEDERRRQAKLQQQILAAKEACEEYDRRIRVEEDDAKKRKQLHKERVLQEEANTRAYEQRLRDLTKVAKAVSEQVEQTKDALRRRR